MIDTHAVYMWKLEVGLIGQFFDWLTRGWYARHILGCTDPRRIGQRPPEEHRD